MWDWIQCVFLFQLELIFDCWLKVDHILYFLNNFQAFHYVKISECAVCFKGSCVPLVPHWTSLGADSPLSCASVIILEIQGKFNYTCDGAPGLQYPHIKMTKTYGMILENCSSPSRKHGKWVAKGKYWYALSTVLNTAAIALWTTPGHPTRLEPEKQHIILFSTCHIHKWLKPTTHCKITKDLL